jgi:hypothetical protein
VIIIPGRGLTVMDCEILTFPTAAVNVRLPKVVKRILNTVPIVLALIILK